MDLLLRLQVSFFVDVQRDDDCAEVREPQGNETAEDATAASDYHDFATHTLQERATKKPSTIDASRATLSILTL